MKNGLAYPLFLLLSISATGFGAEITEGVITSDNARNAITKAFDEIYTKKSNPDIKKALENAINIAWGYIDKKEFNIDDMRTFTCFTRRDDYVAPLFITGMKLSPVEAVLNDHPLAKKSTLLGSLVSRNVYTVKNAFLAKLCVYTRSPRLIPRIAYIYNENPELNVRFVVQAQLDSIMGQIKAGRKGEEIKKGIHFQFLLLPITEAQMAQKILIHEFPYRSEKEFTGSYFHGLARELVNSAYRSSGFTLEQQKTFADCIKMLIAEQLSHLYLYPEPIRQLKLILQPSSPDGKQVEQSCQELNTLLSDQPKPWQDALTYLKNAITNTKRALLPIAQEEAKQQEAVIFSCIGIVEKISRNEQVTQDEINLLAKIMRIQPAQLLNPQVFEKTIGYITQQGEQIEANLKFLDAVQTLIPPKQLKKSQTPPAPKSQEIPADPVDLLAQELYKIVHQH